MPIIDMETIKAATAVEKSSNSKITGNGIGVVSATMVAQASCPTSCPLYKNGCYAESGFVGIRTAQLNKTEVTSPVELAREEAREISKLTGRYPLRLHVVGDCKTQEAAEIVSQAALEYSNKHGMSVWTYTHAYDVPREAWRNVSVFRSVQTPQEAETAIAEGYAPAMVVPEFESDKPYKISDNITGIPCPQQTGKKEGCVTCKLCYHADKLRDCNKAILFAVHGVSEKRLKNTLNVMNNR